MKNFWLTATSIFFCSWILIHRLKQINSKHPKTWPLIGAAIEQLLNYHRMHDWLVNYLAKSSTVVVHMPFATYTYIAHPENVEHVMEVLLGDGIFNVDGELWRKQRKTASFEFASKNLRDFSSIVFREYSLKLHQILLRSSYEDRKQVDMQELLMRMTLDSICKVGFGVEIRTLLDSDSPDNKFAEGFDAANTAVTLRFIDPFWRVKRFLNIGSEAVLSRSIRIIDDFTYSVIKRRKSEIEETKNQGKMNKHDILSRFIELSKDSENNISDKSLRDIVLNFVIAGRDTTATTLSWAIYMTIEHESVAEELYGELRKFEENYAREVGMKLSESLNERVEQFAEMLNYDTVGKLYYLHAVITETLRLYPAVPQAGPRICLGKDSAYLQMKMAMAILIRFYKFRLVPGQLVKYRMMTTLSMENGLKVTVSRRPE